MSRAVSMSPRNIKRRQEYLLVAEERRHASREWRRRNPERAKARDSKLHRSYGMTESQFQVMLAEHGGVCAICKQPPKRNRRLGIDHCHTTGRVRGLLCDPCNLGIGNLKDSPDLLEKSAAYIRQHSARTDEGIVHVSFRKAASRTLWQEPAK